MKKYKRWPVKAKEGQEICLDGSLEALKIVWADCVSRWPLDELEIAQCRKVNAKILEGIGRLVHDQDVYS